MIRLKLHTDAICLDRAAAKLHIRHHDVQHIFSDKSFEDIHPVTHLRTGVWQR